MKKSYILIILLISFLTSSFQSAFAQCDPDPDPPVFDFCPPITVVTNLPGECGADVLYPMPIAFDFCGPVDLTLEQGFLPGEFFPVGLTHVVWIATDVSGNFSSCEFDVIVEDIEPPIINCPPDISLFEESPGSGEAIVNYSEPTVIDNCPGAVVSLFDGQGSGGLFSLGEHVETWVGTDAVGNQSFCTISITVLPVPGFELFVDAGPGKTVYYGFADSACTILTPVVTGGTPPYSYRWCPILEIDNPEIPEPQVCPPASFYYTLVVTDAAGQTANDRVLVTVEDVLCKGEVAPSLDTTDLRGGRIAMIEKYQANVPGHWSTEGLPPLSRLSRMVESLGADPMGPYEAVQEAFLPTAYQNALDNHLFPQDFEALLLSRAFLPDDEAFFLSIKDIVKEMDDLVEAGQGSDPQVAEIQAILTLSVATVLDIVVLNDLGFDPDLGPYICSGTATVDVMCQDNGQGQNGSQLPSIPWEKVKRHDVWQSVHNGKCATAAVGICAYKLGLIKNSSVNCEQWDSLSKAIGAKPLDTTGARQSGIHKFFDQNGASCTEATGSSDPFNPQTPGEEAEAALDAGYDVFMHYSNNQNTKGHVEVVTDIDCETGSGDCSVETISWGTLQTVDVHFSPIGSTSLSWIGFFSNKSNGSAFGDDSYLNTGGVGTFYIYGKK